MNLELTKEDHKRLLDSAKKEIVARILSDNRDDLQLVSPTQAAGILDVNIKTLDALPIPRVEVVAGRVVRYRLSDIRKFLTESTK